MFLPHFNYVPISIVLIICCETLGLETVETSYYHSLPDYSILKLDSFSVQR